MRRAGSRLTGGAAGAAVLAIGLVAGCAQGGGGGSSSGGGATGAATGASGATSSGTSSSGSSSSGSSAAGGGGSSAGSSGLGLRNCTGGSFAAPAAGGFRHFLMRLLATSFAAEHSAQDVIALPGMTASIPGKFAYGSLSKDLEDEDVLLFLDDCAGGWTAIDRARTNGDGRTSIPLDTAARGLATGVYDLRQVVVGDASTVASRLHVLPPTTQLVVFDIDGTLTTSDTELFVDIFDEYFVPLQNGYTPRAYAGALDLARLYASKGYILVYLTGRPYWLTRITREWLDVMGFPPGSLHLADSNGEAWPSTSGVGDYKRDYLRGLQALGYSIEYAYGNASTDIYGYREAGIPTARTFIIGKHAGEQGTQPIRGDYTGHLPVAAQHPAATQPF